MTVYLRDAGGHYLGTLAEQPNGEAPEGSFEVPSGPMHADDLWNGLEWVSDPAATATRFAVDGNGRYLGAFGPGAELPAGAIPIAMPPADGRDTWDSESGLWIANGDVRREDKIRAVDAAAEACRQQFITPGAGQAMTYQEKATQADAYLAVLNGGGTPVDDDYPLLAAEVGITGETTYQVATVISFQHDAWRVIGAQIERIRLGAHKDFETADLSDLDSLLAAIEWPHP